ncbi:MAG: TonB-dependent receptor [Bacteroidota bacterium]
MIMKKITVFGLFLFLSVSLIAQNNAYINGRIVDSSNNPLPGVTIRIADTDMGTASAADGSFQITGLVPDNYDLIFSYIGFETTELEATATDKGTNLMIVMTENTVSLNEVVVTAQHREQFIFDVPVSITSYTNAFFSEYNINEIDALSEYVPGLQVQLQSPNNPGFVVRGITSDSGDSRIEPRVSVFQDGVSISKSRGSVIELFDMERVEVLKGPQGTIFGRGAQIGAVHFVQNKPQPFHAGEITLGYGNYNQRLASGFLNLPVSDKIAVRFAGQFNARDGFIENLAGGDLNGKSTIALRGSLRWKPSTNTTIDLINNFQFDDYPGTAFQSGSLAANPETLDPFSPAFLERGDDLYTERLVMGSTLIANHSFGESLELTSITALRRFDSYESFDADGSSLPALWFAEDAYGDQFSQELRLNINPGERFTSFAGINYFWEKGYQKVPFETDERSMIAMVSPIVNAAKEGAFPELPVYQPDGNPFLGAGELINAPLKPFHRESYANYGNVNALEVFMDGTYEATEKLSLTLGLRGTYEQVKNGYEATFEGDPSIAGGILNEVFGAAPNLLFLPTEGRVEGEGDFLSWVGRIVAGYEFSESLNTYLNISRGRRPQVIEVTASGAEEISEEIVYSYETGIKTILADRRIQFDLSMFLYDYRNFQTNVIEITDGTIRSFTRDAGDASAMGLETAFRYAMVKGVSFFANYALLDASFNDTDRDGNEQVLAGNTFRLTPKHSLSAGLNLEMDSEMGIFFLRPSYTYKSKVYFEEENQQGIEQDAYGLLNARLGYTTTNRKYEIAIFGSNLLDEQYLIDAGNTGLAFGTPTFIAGPPRFFGVQIIAGY